MTTEEQPEEIDFERDILGPEEWAAEYIVTAFRYVLTEADLSWMQVLGLIEMVKSRIWDWICEQYEDDDDDDLEEAAG